MRVANEAVPGAAPALLGQDEASGALAMEYLPPEQLPVVESELRDGQRRPGLRRRGRGRAGPHPRRHRRPIPRSPRSFQPTRSSTTSGWSLT